MVNNPRPEFKRIVKELNLSEPHAVDVALNLFITFVSSNLVDGTEFSICTVAPIPHRNWLKRLAHKAFGCKSTHFTVLATGNMGFVTQDKIRNGQILYLLKDNVEQDD